MKIYKGVPTDAEIESEVKMFNLSLAIAEIAGRAVCAHADSADLLAEAEKLLADTEEANRRFPEL